MKNENVCLPCSTSQKTVNDASLEGAILKLLQEGRFVKGDTRRNSLADYPLTFRHQFRIESVGTDENTC